MNREMKDSGVEWIGEIPYYWTPIKLKHTSNIVRGGSPRPIEAYLTDGTGYNWIKIGDTIKGNKYIKSTKQKIISEGLSKTRYVKKDTLLLTNSMSYGEAYILDIDGCIHDGWLAFSDYQNANKEYLYYCLISAFCKNQFGSIVDGGVVSNLNIEKVKNAMVLLPSPTEQQQIVHFLDCKCTAINIAIEKTEKSIEKLEEYKKAVITKAVTKGIDPNAKMNGAHFLWLTAIPENWGIYKLNHILDYNHPYPLGDGDHGSIKADSYVSSGIPFIRVQNLGYAEPINIENVVYITEAQNQKIQNSTLAPNDILFAKTGATIGKTAIMPQTISRANTTSHIGKITVDTRYYVPKYIFYALSSEIGNHQLWSIANKKATRPEVGLDEVKYIKLCIPLSVTEQKQIADFLDEKLNQINNAISNYANLIRKLEEYKKSLIYYAVTGKTDCRNEVIE